MSTLPTGSYAEELERVERAARYYERFAAHVTGAADARLARYYGVSADTAPALLRFKALFFATRLQPALAHIKAFAAHAGRPPRVLDLGCGYGLETTLLAAAGGEVTGLDLIGAKLEGAAELASRLREAAGCDNPVTYRRASVFDHTPEAPYDVVYSSATLHHIEPAAEACRAIARLVAPGGRFFLSDENGLNPAQQLLVQHKIGWLSPRVVSVVDPQTGERRPHGNENIRPPHVWRRYLAAAGLRSLGIKYCRLLPPLPLGLPALLRAERALRRVPLLRAVAAVGFVEAFERSNTAGWSVDSC